MLSIGVVARQTGIGTATLRKWETRYGFPQPERNAKGRRAYTPAEVDSLLSVVNRLSTGERIGQIMSSIAPGNRLRRRPGKRVGQEAGAAGETLLTALAAIRRCDYTAIKLHMELARRDTTLLDAIEAFLAPLTIAVGEAWEAGTLPIHAEHLYSALLESFLDREANAFPQRGRPRFLLVAPAGEKHTIGLAMAHAVLAERNIHCIRLPSDLPNAEIAAAASLYGVGGVVLSASSHYPPRLLKAQIEQLRGLLSANVHLYLGGGGINRMRSLPADTCAFRSLRAFVTDMTIKRRKQESIK